ncbi:MAG TPA: hypothetical protein DEA96_08525 [Leptospiraceae bacterium]|nr:hypothetical protein [Spirochaetaceae bacterium]HBS04995.1 hypothetical protein [Leptospiraceae bacterium]|tara:strand:- start:6704 stop:7789 length:1086 start_codon:yes stop_codon:yes gene_type:complete
MRSIYLQIKLSAVYLSICALVSCTNIQLSKITYADFVEENVIMGDAKGDLLLVDADRCKKLDSLSTGWVAPQWDKLTEEGNVLVQSRLLSDPRPPEIVQVSDNRLVQKDLKLDGVSEAYGGAGFLFSADLSEAFVSQKGPLGSPALLKWYSMGQNRQKYSLNRVFEIPADSGIFVIGTVFVSPQALLIQGGNGILVLSGNSYGEQDEIQLDFLKSANIGPFLDVVDRNVFFYANKLENETIVPTLIAYDLDTNAAKWTIPLSRSGAIVTSFDSGGDYVAFRMSDNTVIIVNVRKGRSFLLTDLTEKVSLVRVSPSGSRILILQSHSTLVSQTIALEESGSINPSTPPSNCELLHVGFEGSE